MTQALIVAPAQAYTFATAQEMNAMYSDDVPGYVVDGDGTTMMRYRSPGDKRG